jgi:hypothetical protein
MFFVLSSFFLLFGRMVGTRKSRAGRGIWPSSDPFVAGLASKPMVITLPFALLLLDYWPLARVQGTAEN